jgi:hypothetical protein
MQPVSHGHSSTVPHPSREPRSARSAVSPPVEPPGVNSGFRGWVVTPKRGFSVSHHCRDMSSSYISWGTKTCHYALRQIRLGQKDNTTILKNLHEIRIVDGWVERSAYISKSSIIPFNIELVLQCHWYAVKWSDGLSMAGKVLIQGVCALNSSLEQNFCRVRRSSLVFKQYGVPVRQFVLIR